MFSGPCHFFFHLILIRSIYVYAILISKLTFVDSLQAQIALRNNRSFAEFPARMQRMIAECGHYEA